MPTTPPHDGRGIARAPALSREVPGAPAAVPGTRGRTPGNMKATLIAASLPRRCHSLRRALLLQSLAFRVDQRACTASWPGVRIPHGRTP